jgi:spore germination protein KB
MKLEKGRISNIQLMFLATSFLQSKILTINFNYGITKQDTWIAVLAASAIAVLMAVVYTAIAQRLAGKNLIEINDTVFGSISGKIVSALYVWFFFQSMIHYGYFFNSFWINFIMTETPRAAFLILFFFVCAMAVRGGIEVITRCGYIFAIITGAMIIAATILLIKDMDPSNLLPILETSPKEFIHSVQILLAIPLCDLVALLMVFPYTTDNTKVRKPILIAIFISVIFLQIVVLEDFLVLGERAINSSSASFAITREIDIADVLTRLDVLVAISLLTTVFMKITMFYYVTVFGLAQTLGLRTYRPLVIPIGVMAITISSVLYQSDMEQAYAAKNVWPFNTVLFQVLLPIITLIVMAVRKIPKKEGASE